jgi:hypothetical protein
VGRHHRRNKRKHREAKDAPAKQPASVQPAPEPTPTPATPEPARPGGQGGDPDPTRSECVLVGQAVRNDWGIPPEMQREILERLVGFVREPDRGVHAPASRTVVAAARTIGLLCGLGLKQQELDLHREKFAGKQSEHSLAELVAAAEERARQRKVERER